MSKVTDSARGQPCTIMLPCCYAGPENETVVFCHFRMLGISGFGFKTEAPVGAYGCYSCHQVVDTTKDPEVVLAFLKGCMRTIDSMWKRGIIRAT